MDGILERAQFPGKTILAMMMLWLELQILERLTIPIDSAQLRPVGSLRTTGSVPVR